MPAGSRDHPQHPFRSRLLALGAGLWLVSACSVSDHGIGVVGDGGVNVVRPLVDAPTDRTNPPPPDTSAGEAPRDLPPAPDLVAPADLAPPSDVSLPPDVSPPPPEAPPADVRPPDLPPDAPPPECRPGEMRCMGALRVQICGPDGRWRAPADCPPKNVCAEGTCRYQAPVIQITAGIYGRNCQGMGLPAAPPGARPDQTAHLARACNGKVSCEYDVDHLVIGDPAVGCGKIYEAAWRCVSGATQTIHMHTLPAEASFGPSLKIACAP